MRNRVPKVYIYFSSKNYLKLNVSEAVAERLVTEIESERNRGFNGFCTINYAIDDQNTESKVINLSTIDYIDIYW